MKYEYEVCFHKVPPALRVNSSKKKQCWKRAGRVRRPSPRGKRQVRSTTRDELAQGRERAGATPGRDGIKRPLVLR